MKSSLRAHSDLLEHTNEEINKNKNFYPNQDNLLKKNQFDSEGAVNEDSENSISNKKQSKTKFKKNKKERKYFFTLRYTVLLFTLWIVFIGAFIIGFILRYVYDKKIPLNASSIVWAFSSFLFLINSIYTYLYWKAKNAINNEERKKYLRFIPI